MSDTTDRVVYGAEPEAAAFAKALGLDSDLVHRIVLDIQSDAFAVAYVEMFVTKKALEIVTGAPKGIEVKVIDKAEGEHPGEIGMQRVP